MRMMKRVAVGILTAAMALSMLTACGGGGGNANSGGNSNGGGSSNGSSNSGSSSSSGSTSGGSNNGSNGSTIKDDLTKLPDETEIKYADSQTAKWRRLRSNSGTWYMKTESAGTQSKYIREQSYNGKKQYNKTTYANGTIYENFYDGTTSYSLYSKHKIAVIHVFNSSGSTSSESYRLTNVKKTTAIEEKVPYYTEVMTYTGETTGKTMTDTYSFDSTGKLTYMTTTYSDGTQSKTHVLSYSTSLPDNAIWEIPSDWGVYTSTYDGKNTTVTNKDGRELTSEELNVFYSKIYNR